MLISSLLTICVILVLYFFKTQNTSCKVYLIDFACYKPPSSQKWPKERVSHWLRTSGLFSEENLDFMNKAIERGGLGDSSYLPEIFSRPIPTYKPSLQDSRREAEMAIFGSLDKLLAKSGVRCDDIGILVANCCIYNPVPSLSSIIVNKYKLRDDIITYDLVGMGCTAGLLAVGLAKQLLQVHENSYALVVSTESLTENFYHGNDRSKFHINCLFRIGGAAILLSNRPSDHNISKYQLLHTIHTNTSSSDRSYNCIFREEDTDGQVGVTISTKDIINAAKSTIKPNVTTLGYLILPLEEKLAYSMNYIVRKIFSTFNIKLYIPNYSKAVDHFLPHVGGKPVLDELQKLLGFSDAHMEASRMTLYRYGNTSSSSIWYELAYTEAKGRVKKGNVVWQIAFGSGFKCNSVVWRAMKNIECDEYNPWRDEIDGFPVTREDIGPYPGFNEQ